MERELDSKHQHDEETQKNNSIYAEKAEIQDYKADAIEAENIEHNQTVLQAVRAYPWATFWAVVFSCTIVRSPFLFAPHAASRS